MSRNCWQLCIPGGWHFTGDELFSVIADHNPLVYLQTQSELSKQQTPWSADVYLQVATQARQIKCCQSTQQKPWCGTHDNCKAVPRLGCWPSSGLKQVMVHRSVSHFYRGGGVLCCDYTQSGKNASSLCCACAQALECHSHTGIWTC